MQDTKLLEEGISLKAIVYNKEKVQSTNRFHSDTEQETINLFEIEKRLQKNKIKLKKIDASMCLLSAVQRKIITEFYIEDIGWLVLSHQVNMSVRQCQRERDEALSKINLFLYGEMIDKKTGASQMALYVMKV